jgi:hypothetical protein
MLLTSEIDAITNAILRAYPDGGIMTATQAVPGWGGSARIFVALDRGPLSCGRFASCVWDGRGFASGRYFDDVATAIRVTLDRAAGR